MVKNTPANAGDIIDPWVWKIPWRRAWQPTPVFLPGESHGQRSLGATVQRVAKSWTQLKGLRIHTLTGDNRGDLNMNCLLDSYINVKFLDFDIVIMSENVFILRR